MSSDEDMAREWGKKMEKYSTELEANISDTRKIGIKEKDALKLEGIEEEQRMLKEAYSMVEDKISKARAEIEKKRQKAGDSLNKEIKSFSMDLAEKFLGRSI